MFVPFIVKYFTDSNIEVKGKRRKSADFADKTRLRAPALAAQARVPTPKAPVLGVPARLPIALARMLLPAADVLTASAHVLAVQAEGHKEQKTDENSKNYILRPNPR